MCAYWIAPSQLMEGTASQVCVTPENPIIQEQLQAELLRSSIEIERYLNTMESDIRKYIRQKSSWVYAPFCGVL
jgi:hypothetical protein